MDRGECGMGCIGFDVRKRSEREMAAGHGAGDFLERFDFRRRQAEPRQPGRARPQDGLRRHRIEGRGEPAPDRAGAGGRKLLRHHGCGDAGKAVGTPPQWRPPRFGHKRAKSRLDFAEHFERRVEIGFGANMCQHVRVRVRCS